MTRAYNLLDEPLVHAAPCGMLSLPELLAVLASDKVESFPALRPHQAPSWHMFLVQLAALALHEAGESAIPEGEENWGRLLRGLTNEFPDDEPWCLVVEDWTIPAFLQPPVPKSLTLKNELGSADALDLLITSKNHDLKQAVARDGAAEDWLFALVSLQTGEGYGGAGNQGIARMNGGSSSRPMLAIAPMAVASGQGMTPRPGAWFHRDVRVLIETRNAELERLSSEDYYRHTGGLCLTWLLPWPEGEQLQIKDLDIWFIEVCRRVRLAQRDRRLAAFRGTSKATRINAKHLKGALSDPWAPVHKTENKSFTLASGNFNYHTLTDLLLGDWMVPLLARSASFETSGDTLLLVAAALARGNSKTEGFKSRMLPIAGRVSRVLGTKREELHQLAQDQVRAIADFDKALGYALVLAVAGGERERIKTEHYTFARDAHAHLDRFADSIFFEHLWRRFEAQEQGAETLEAEKRCFAHLLWARTQAIFEQFLPAMPCSGLFRPRAEARARRALASRNLRKTYPKLFKPANKGKRVSHAA